MTRATHAAMIAALSLAWASASDAPLLSRERALIERWLGCIECDIALDSLRAVGARNPAATIDVLNGTLRTGPPHEKILSADSALRVSFVRDSAYRARTGRGTIPRRDDYVADGRERYRTAYQIRGAIGLGWIGTPAAKARLDSAATLPLPADVKAAIAFARDSLP